MSAPMKAYDVVIVGGGVVGSASAHYLRKNGFTGSIALVEKDTSWALGCTARSVGGLRQQFSTPENIHLSKFGVTLVKNLKQEFGPDSDIGFKEQGYLICATPEGLPILEENHAVQIANGADNVLLRGDELAARFPWLVTEGIAAGCFGLSGEGWVDPYMFAALFRKSAIAKGVELIQDEVTGVTRERQRITGVTLASAEAISCGTLVNAAGANGRKVAALAGIDIPVVPKKRFVYTFHCKEALAGVPLLIDPSGAWCRPEGRPDASGQLFIGSIAPAEGEPDPEMDDNDFSVDPHLFEDQLWPLLAHRIPAFEQIRPGRAWAGPYDMNLFDHNAILGPVGDIDNLLLANGFSGHGLQQSPAVGRALAEWVIHGHYRTLDVSDLGFDRIAKQRPVLEKCII